MEQVDFALPGAVSTYSAKSALFTAGYADRGTFFDCTGTFTITLDTTSMAAGWSGWFRNVSGTQTFDPTGATLINGAATYAVSNAGDVTLVEYTGSAFVISQSQLPAAVKITGGTIIGVTISGSTFIGATLSGTTLVGTTTITGTSNLSGAALLGGTYSGSTLIAPTVSGATVVGTTSLTGTVNASGSAVLGGTLSGSTLIGPTASGITLVGTSVVTGTANLTGASILGGTYSGVVSMKFASSSGTLAHYEEGTFTPVIAGSTTAGSQTYTLQSGRYVRIGRLVYIHFDVALSALDGATAGNVLITGLPFTCAAAAVNGSLTIGLMTNTTLSAGKVWWTARIAPTQSQVTMEENASAGAKTSLPVTNLSATTEIRCAGFYEV